MRQLSGLDAGFLALESDSAPMLVGSASILDPRTPDGRLDLDGFRALIGSRLGYAKAFRRRLAEVPLDLTRPYWTELAADQVDLEAHIQRTRLPEPGGWKELGELLAWEMAQPLDRSRPLWQILFVEGVDGVDGVPEGSVALVAKVHHAAIDGVSGAEILAALFDGVPRPRPEAATERPPRAVDLLLRAGRDMTSVPLEATRAAGRSLVGLAAGTWERLGGATPPPLPFTAPTTVLNRPLSDRQSWAPAFFELERIKAVKNACGGTVNDVVLAIAAGALRDWLGERGELPDEALVAMVPVSVRTDDERGEAGNRVSAMLVDLATDVTGPGDRLERIRDAARASKRSLQALGARTLVDSAELLPFGLSGLAARASSGLHLAGRHRPPFNLVVTNVPGPPRTLTVGGAPMLSYAGAAPLFDGLRLILPVLSYAGTVSFGVTADRALLPDARVLATRLERSLDELEAAVAG